ncbi:DUF1007 family protein [Mameliella alba]|nr:DUF1007 family protein [Antarctobacter heliothermus]MBY6144137.1 DUF1007 family protein [Mameliella alba]MCA0954186.1 DUF1007 family protein [Mameliella alba]
MPQSLSPFRRMGAGLVAACLWTGGPAPAHPHVFVDGGVDFLLGEGPSLQAIEITWLYDAFETLYILSSHGLELNAKGELSEDDRQKLISYRSQWPADFDGSAHLAMGGQTVDLQWPRALDARLRDGRLEIRFTRDLEEPLDLSGRTLDVGFYESTYFFAFSVTKPPRITGTTKGCDARVVPFNADAETAALKATLRQLSREETPDIANVGALFADRIALQCGS